MKPSRTRAFLQKLLVAADDVHPKVIAVSSKRQCLQRTSGRNAGSLFVSAMRQSTASTRRSRSVGWSRLPRSVGANVSGLRHGGGVRRRDRVTSGKVGIFQRWAMRFTRGQDELSVAFRESYAAHAVPQAKTNRHFRLSCGAMSPCSWPMPNDVLRSQRSSGTNATRLDYRMAGRCVDVAVAPLVRAPRPHEGFRSVRRSSSADPQPELPSSRDRPRRGCRRKRHGGCNRPVDRAGHSRKTLSARSWPPPRRSIWFPFREQMMMWDATERVAIVRGGADPSLRGGRSRSWWTCLSGQAGRKGSTSASFRGRTGGVVDGPNVSMAPPPWASFWSTFPQLGKEERAEVLARYAPAPRRVRGARQPGRTAARRIQDAFNTPLLPDDDPRREPDDAGRPQPSAPVPTRRAPRPTLEPRRTWATRGALIARSLAERRLTQRQAGPMGHHPHRALRLPGGARHRPIAGIPARRGARGSGSTFYSACRRRWVAGISMRVRCLPATLGALRRGPARAARTTR